jgi:hypothetical protein
VQPPLNPLYALLSSAAGWPDRSALSIGANVQRSSQCPPEELCDERDLTQEVEDCNAIKIAGERDTSVASGATGVQSARGEA